MYLQHLIYINGEHVAIMLVENNLVAITYFTKIYLWLLFSCIEM